MVTYRGCICTREFDEAVKRVGQRDYSEIGQILRAETERSIKDLKKAVSRKNGRFNVK